MRWLPIFSGRYFPWPLLSWAATLQKCYLVGIFFYLRTIFFRYICLFLRDFKPKSRFFNEIFNWMIFFFFNICLFWTFFKNKRLFINEILLFIYIFNKIYMCYITKLFTIENNSFLLNPLSKYWLFFVFLSQ